MIRITLTLLALLLIAGAYAQERILWYAGVFNTSRLGDFGSAMGTAMNTAISSASTPPGSSSGAGGGGFSGGGGGGGGGGGR